MILYGILKSEYNSRPILTTYELLLCYTDVLEYKRIRQIEQNQISFKSTDEWIDGIEESNDYV